MAKSKNRDHSEKSTYSYSRANWYPQGQFYGYAFLKTLETNRDNTKLFDFASRKYNERKGGLYINSKPANLDSLKSLAEYCRQKEINLLKEQQIPFDEHDSSQIGSYIRAFNQLLGSLSTFERNISRIQKIAINKKTGNLGGGSRIDITTQFAEKLNQRIRKEGFEFNEDKLREAVKEALIDIFSQPGLESDEIEDYAQILQEIRGISPNPGENSTNIVDELFKVYMGPDILSELDSVGKYHKKNKKLSKDSIEKLKKNMSYQSWFGNKKGAVLEAVERLVMDVLHKNFDSFATGSSGMKADNIYTLVTGEVSVDINTMLNERIEGDYKSLRLQNIDRLQNMHDKLKGLKGQIIEVTDKNYSLTSKSFADNKGFTGESAIQAGFFQEILYKMLGGSKTGEIADLMFILANMNEQMLSTDLASDKNLMEHFLAAYIGYFLFDDLSIENFDDSMNFVHVMNLDGIFIPFSTFLFAALHAFDHLSQPEEVDKYAKIELTDNFKGLDLPEGQRTTKEDWQNFYDQRLQEVRITAHFFGDFVNFIKQNVKL